MPHPEQSDRLQLTLTDGSFDTELHGRIQTAQTVQTQACHLFQSLNEQREGEWQPACIDQAVHYTTLALDAVQEEDQFDDYLDLAVDTLLASEAMFEDVSIPDAPALPAGIDPRSR